MKSVSQLYIISNDCIALYTIAFCSRDFLEVLVIKTHTPPTRQGLHQAICAVMEILS